MDYGLRIEDCGFPAPPEHPAGRPGDQPATRNPQLGHDGGLWPRPGSERWLGARPLTTRRRDLVGEGGWAEGSQSAIFNPQSVIGWLGA